MPELPEVFEFAEPSHLEAKLLLCNFTHGETDGLYMCTFVNVCVLWQVELWTDEFVMPDYVTPELAYWQQW